jgi:hypothetical protein
MDETEHGCVQADADGERRDCDCRRQRRATKLPKAVSGIHHHTVNQTRRTHIPSSVGDLVG